MFTDDEIIERYSKTKTGKTLRDRLYKIDCPKDLIADVLSCLETEENHSKMIDVLNHGATSEQDLLLACIYIDRGMEVEYKKTF